MIMPGICRIVSRPKNEKIDGNLFQLLYRKGPSFTPLEPVRRLSEARPGSAIPPMPAIPEVLVEGLCTPTFLSLDILSVYR